MSRYYLVVYGMAQTEHMFFWGGVHGSLQIIENVCKLNRKKRYRFLSVTVVFLLITYAWIFFRADTLQDAFYILRYMFDGIDSPYEYIRNGLAAIGIGRVTYIKIGMSLIVLLAFDYINQKKDPLIEISRFPKVVRWGIYYILGFVLIIYSIQNMGANPFVYFQF